MGALLGDARLQRALDSLKGNIARAVANMPEHRQFLQDYCSQARP
jgi:tryptophan halogenase